MRRRGTWLAIAALIATSAAIFAATFDRNQSAPRPDPSGVLEIESDARHQYGNLDQLVDASDLVVSGRVVATERGRVFGDGSDSAAIRSHVLTVRVDSVLAGSSSARASVRPDVVVLVEEEAELTDGTPVAVDGMRAGRVGDRGIWFLVASGDPDFPGYAVLNAQGRYLFGSGDALRGGDASDSLVAELEQLGAAKLSAAITRAAAPAP